MENKDALILITEAIEKAGHKGKVSLGIKYHKFDILIFFINF